MARRRKGSEWGWRRIWELDESKIDGKKKEKWKKVNEEEYEKELDESTIDGKKKERGEKEGGDEDDKEE